MSTPLYETLGQTGQGLGYYVSPDGNFSTYFGPGYYQPWYRCFCKDGCPPAQPTCGRCASQQFCGSCDMQMSAYCDTANVYGGLGWI